MANKRKRSKSVIKTEKESTGESKTIVLDPIRFSDEPALKKVRVVQIFDELIAI